MRNQLIGALGAASKAAHGVPMKAPSSRDLLVSGLVCALLMAAPRVNAQALSQILIDESVEGASRSVSFSPDIAGQFTAQVVHLGSYPEAWDIGIAALSSTYSPPAGFGGDVYEPVTFTVSDTLFFITENKAGPRVDFNLFSDDEQGTPFFHCGGGPIENSVNG